MNDFVYYNPVRVHFGRNALEALADELAVYGPRVLLAYGGGSIRRTGLYDQVMAVLTEAGKQVTEFSGILPNPRMEKVYEGASLCREEKIDLILAVGGGSVIDCAKAVAIAACEEEDFWQKFYVNWEEPKAAIPLGTILTIPATGSEMDKDAVITNPVTGEKNSYAHPLLYPQFSILDPTLTYTLPKEQMVNGIVDTMSHILELYVSPPDTDCLTDELAEAAMRTEIRAARTALKDPQDYDARADLMWTSSFALCGMLNNGKKTDWAAHCIQHPTSALFDVAHGAGLAVVHPAYLDYICREAASRLARMAVQVWQVDPAGKTEEETAREGICALKKFFREELGAAASLAELGIPKESIPQLVRLTDLSCWSYRELTAGDVQKILEACYAE